MRTTTLAMAAAALLAAGAASAALPPPERVTFDSLDRDAAGAPVRITALLYKPEGAPPAAGFAAVIALHGCGGLYSARPGREDRLSGRHAAWAQRLLGDGYAVLFPDSFNPRGRRQVCTIKPSERGINPMRRRLDALGALAWLATHAGVDGRRIALLGWSHGGSTALAAVNARDTEVIAFRAAPGAPPFFRAAVAFYPGCGRSLRSDERWQPGAPLEIHIGTADDWTPAAPCIALAGLHRVRGDPLDLYLYPDSYHGFDGPGKGLVVRKDVATGVNPAQGVTVGPNREAAAEAVARTRAFLRARLAPLPAAAGRAPKDPAARG
jgi:dienelactone hydrolase